MGGACYRFLIFWRWSFVTGYILFLFGQQHFCFCFSCLSRLLLLGFQLLTWTVQGRKETHSKRLETRLQLEHLWSIFRIYLHNSLLYVSLQSSSLVLFWLFCMVFHSGPEKIGTISIYLWLVISLLRSNDLLWLTVPLLSSYFSDENLWGYFIHGSPRRDI